MESPKETTPGVVLQAVSYGGFVALIAIMWHVGRYGDDAVYGAFFAFAAGLLTGVFATLSAWRRTL